MQLLPGEFDRTATSLASETNGRYASRGKRMLDLCGCVLLAPLGLVLIAMLWVAARLDGGPGFFSHHRIGRNGVPFRCWKIRTMVPDAEARLRDILHHDPVAAAEWAATFKLEKDPRVTGLGYWLRRLSLDELPQLWNVLRGEMSLVGPRPVTAEEVQRYGGYRWAYLSAKPGLTGLWQVSGRNALSYDARIQMDIDYLNRQSLGLDLSILFRTVGAVLKISGR